MAKEKLSKYESDMIKIPGFKIFFRLEFHDQGGGLHILHTVQRFLQLVSHILIEAGIYF